MHKAALAKFWTGTNHLNREGETDHSTVVESNYIVSGTDGSRGSEVLSVIEIFRQLLNWFLVIHLRIVTAQSRLDELDE